MDKGGLGKRINTARKEQGITSERLSELCNINATYLRQIESGRKTPSLPVFVEISKQLHVSPNYLLLDSLDGNEYEEMSALMQLLSTATPSQSKLVMRILKSALDALQEE